MNYFCKTVLGLTFLQLVYCKYFKVSTELARSKSIKQKQMRHFGQTLRLNTELETENGKYLIK